MSGGGVTMEWLMEDRISPDAMLCYSALRAFTNEWIECLQD